MAGTVLKIKQSAVAGRLPTHSAGSTYIEQGELALNTADQKLYSKDASGTIFEIGASSGGGAAGANEIVTTDFTATNAQTTFSVSYTYTTDHVNVYYNGVKLSPDEYTATNGTSVVLDTGATTGATISIEVIKALSLANGSDITEYEYTATSGQTTFTITDGYNSSNSDIEVYVNGVKIPSADFTANNDTTVVLGTGAAVNDQVAIRVIKVTVLTATVSQTSETGSAIIPAGTTAERDASPVAGYLRWNSTLNRAEIYNDNTSSWQDVGQQTLTTEEVQDALGPMLSGNTESGITVTYDDANNQIDFTVASQTANDFTNALKTKLDGIETSATADQTGAQIKTAYEAETSAFTDALFTKLSNIETSATADQTGAEIKTLYAAETSAFTDAQFTKLSNIETAATADQTAAEIRTLVGSATDSNVYDDAAVTKLSGIEASADVTDATNVNAAGALMLSDTTTAGLGIVIDEDNMASDLSTKVPTQQSVKAYVDTEVAAAVTASDLDFQADSGGALAIDLDSEVLTFSGGTGITTVGNANDVSFGIDSTVSTLTGSQILTNKTLTSPVLNTSLSGTAFLDEDNMASDSATAAASQQSIKAYVDTQLATQDSLSELSGTLDDITDGTTYKRMSATEQTKLSNIETSATADQTGAEIKTLYEAESNAFTDAQYTKLSGIETSADVTDTTNVVAALTAGTGITIASDGTLAVGPVALTTVQVAASQSAQLALTAQEGDVVVRSDEKKSYIHNGGSAGSMADYTELQTPTDSVLSVGGYTGTVSAAQIKTAYESNSDTNEFSNAEQTKLSGIETSATADQTAAEIKTLYESNSDTNEYSDAEQTKLSNIETSADVTDSTNVASAGAVMESDTTTAAMGFVLDEDNMASNSNTKLSTQQAIKAYVDNQINLVPDAVAMAIALG